MEQAASFEGEQNKILVARLAEFETQLGGFGDSLRALEGSSSSSASAERLEELSSKLQAMEQAASFEGEQNKILVARLAEFETLLGGFGDSLKALEASSTSSSASAVGSDQLEEAPSQTSESRRQQTDSEVCRFDKWEAELKELTDA